MSFTGSYTKDEPNFAPKLRSNLSPMIFIRKLYGAETEEIARNKDICLYVGIFDCGLYFCINKL